jgi:hypothetical protein
MPPYSHLDLIQERYPQPGCLKVYHALRLTICGRGTELDWEDFNESDWALIGEMAARDGVAGLLYQQWKQGKRPKNAPVLLVAQLGGAFMRNQANFAAIQSELTTRIEPALKAARQTMVLLKGAALASTLYEQPGLRPMVDIDCLVDRQNLERVVSVLNNIDYAKNSDGLLIPGVAYFEYHLVMMRKGPPAFMLELHHTLMAAREEHFNLDTNWFLTQTEPLSGNLLTLTPTAHLLHLVVHLMMHHGEGESDLLHFFDIHLLLERWATRIDWDELLEAARNMNLDYVVYAALQGCTERFETKLPATFSHPPAGPRVQMVKNFIETRKKPIPPTHTERYLKKLADRPLGMQIALALRFAFPQPEFMRRRYALKPLWLWPLSYPLRWTIGLRHLFSMLLRQIKQ